MPLPRPEDLGLPPTAVVVVTVPEPRPEDFEPTFTRPQAQLRGIDARCAIGMTMPDPGSTSGGS